ncbi:MAG: glycosyltransferase family 4 protein [Gaiellaceae bacterium]
MRVASRLRRLAAPPRRASARGIVGLRTHGWDPHSRLFVLGDRGGWSVDEDAEHVAAAARRLGCQVGPQGWAQLTGKQSVFHTSHFEAVEPRWTSSSHRLGVAWLHGRPGTPGAPEFDRAFNVLRDDPERFSAVQVTHAEMEELVLAAGVDAPRVFRIPIGVDIEHFPAADAQRRADARPAFGLPPDAFVVGSFQKDGVGWGEGLTPKLIKGPDVLVDTLGRLREAVPGVVVLLTGPARGYVRGELERLRIPYRHALLASRAELARAYSALDVQIVTSRQEGGPKAVLEAMASGVPLVSTRVGQAAELVEHGVNGWLADVDDAEALAALAARVYAGTDAAVLAAGRATAERFALKRLEPLWARLFERLLDRPEGT